MNFTKDEEPGWVWCNDGEEPYPVTNRLTVEKCEQLAELFGDSLDTLWFDEVADYDARKLDSVRQQLKDFGADVSAWPDVAVAWADLRLREELADEARSVENPWTWFHPERSTERICKRVLDEIEGRIKESVTNG